jgi:hypothetical protein
MDYFTAFAMTATFAMTSLFMESLLHPTRYRTRTLNLTPSLRAKRGSPCSQEVMDCFTAFAMTATFAMTSLFMESLLHPTRYRTRTLNLTPSLRAKRGSPCSQEVMDCFTAACPEPVEGFAMTTNSRK